MPLRPSGCEGLGVFRWDVEAIWAVCPISFASVKISGWFSVLGSVVANLKLLDEVEELVPTEPNGSARQFGVRNTLLAHPLIQGARLDSQEFGGLCFGQNHPDIDLNYRFHEGPP
jgi:hypothetical protein